jgi:hypothetical protein
MRIEMHLGHVEVLVFHLTDLEEGSLTPLAEEEPREAIRLSQWDSVQAGEELVGSGILHKRAVREETQIREADHSINYFKQLVWLWRADLCFYNSNV